MPVVAGGQEVIVRDQAFRRDKVVRAKQQAKQKLIRREHANDRPVSEITPKEIAKTAVDRTPCSCPICGNPRRYLGEVTLQEKLADQHCKCVLTE